jgi:hypothetical protein
VSPSCSQRSGVKLRASGMPHLAPEVPMSSIQNWSSGCGPSMGHPVSSFRAAVPPAWSRWPWVIQIFSSVSPCSFSAANNRGTSPPGSMIAAFRVLAHHTMVQFCCSGVTGAMSARIGRGGGVGAFMSGL